MDPQRISIGGHSSGGSFAYVLAYGTVSRFAGVFSLSAPFRPVIDVADLDYAAPIHLYYGTEDPNFFGASYAAIVDQLDRLGVEFEADIQSGFGHSEWPDSSFIGGFEFLLSKRYTTPGGCVPSETRLCLRDGRFAVEATWRDFKDNTGPARVSADTRTSESGILWFFQARNWEMTLKVINGCTLNDRYWVFASGSTTVEWSLTVSDLLAGESRTYTNPLGTASAAVTDTSAFATCP